MSAENGKPWNRFALNNINDPPLGSPLHELIYFKADIRSLNFNIL